jgi:hypothetical protein
MLTDAEVDRRFFELVASLNSAAVAVEWPSVSDPAEQFPSDEPTASSSDEEQSLGVLRLVAVLTVVITIAVGVAAAEAAHLGWVFFALWLGVVVPGVTLVSLLVADRVRRRSS